MCSDLTCGLSTGNNSGLAACSHSPARQPQGRHTHATLSAGNNSELAACHGAAPAIIHEQTRLKRNKQPLTWRGTQLQRLQLPQRFKAAGRRQAAAAGGGPRQHEQMSS